MSGQERDRYVEPGRYCPVHGWGLVRFGPDEGGVYTHVCPAGDTIQLTHYRRAGSEPGGWVITLRPGTWYASEVERLEPSESPHSPT